MCPPTPLVYPNYISLAIPNRRLGLFKESGRGFDVEDQLLRKTVDESSVEWVSIDEAEFHAHSGPVVSREQSSHNTGDLT